MSELEKDLDELGEPQYSEDINEYANLKAQWLIKMNELIDKYKLDKRCPRCSTSLIPSVISDYDYQCLYCDEDFYDCEVE